MNIFIVGIFCHYVKCSFFRIMVVNSKKTPKGRLVEVDGIKYQLIEGKRLPFSEIDTLIEIDKTRRLIPV